MNDSNQNTYIIAGSVIIAGLLIGAGIFFGSGQTSSQATNEQAAETETNTAQAQEIGIAEVAEEDWIRGDMDASVQVVEYSDPECPFCQRFHGTMNQVVNNYDASEVSWVYRHFPIPQLHPQAPEIASAMECAGRIGGQDTFWEFADLVYEGSGGTEPLSGYAEEVGLDTAEYNSCVEDGEYQDEVSSEAQDASANGGQGTPYSVIVTERGNTYALPGAVPFAPMQQILDTILAGIDNDTSADEIQGEINSIIGQ